MSLVIDPDAWKQWVDKVLDFLGCDLEAFVISKVEAELVRDLFLAGQLNDYVTYTVDSKRNIVPVIAGVKVVVTDKVRPFMNLYVVKGLKPDTPTGNGPNPVFPGNHNDNGPKGPSGGGTPAAMKVAA